MPPWAKLVTARARSVPWMVLYKAATWLYGRGQQFWDNLSSGERSELGRLIRASKGRRSNLSDREAERLRSLVRKGFTGSG